MQTLAEIKLNYETCSNQDVHTLKTAVKDCLGITEDIMMHVWPYTQLMYVVCDSGDSYWVGICDQDSELSTGSECSCGECSWFMGLV